jgi:hypothetical protein
VDELATFARDRVLKNMIIPVKQDLFPGTIASFETSDGFLIHNNRNEAVQIVANYNSLQEYLCDKHNWSSNSFRLIRWEAHKRALDAFCPATKPSVIKLIHIWQHTNEWKFQLLTDKDGTANTFKLCGCSESNDHVFTCTSSRMRKARYNGWKNLQKNMEKCTNKAILEKIWMRFRSVTNGVPAEYGPDFSNDKKFIQHCFTDQSQIGWKNFFSRKNCALMGRNEPHLFIAKTYT